MAHDATEAKARRAVSANPLAPFLTDTGGIMTACATCGAAPCINPDFCRVCRDADQHKTKGRHVAHLRRLMSDSISLDRALDEISRAARERHEEAPAATYHAVVYELRTHGLSQLRQSSCQHRLGNLSAAQLRAVMVSLHALRDQYPKISDELLFQLASIYDARVANGE